MTVSSSEDVGAPGAMAPFSLETILLNMEGGRYVGPFITVPLVDMVSGRRGGSITSRRRGGNEGGGKGYVCGSGGGSGGDGVRGGCTGWGSSGSGGGGAGSTARVRVCYDAHPTALYLQDRENLRTVLAGTVLTTVQGHVICNNWHLYGLCWGDCERKKLHVLTS